MSKITLRRQPNSPTAPRLSTLLRAILLLLTVTCTSTHADTDSRYLELDGYVHFEAENAGDSGAWSLQSGLDGYSGTGYLEWTGSNYFAESEAGVGTIVYHIRIETAGDYEFRWRSRIARGDSNTESNDSWVRFATGSNVAGEHPLDGWTKVYMGEAGVWSWSARTVDQQAKPVRQYFSQGDHTIELSGRSNGHAIDRLALYRYNDVNFDPGLNGTLPLSTYLRDNGTTVDPNPMIVPEPEDVLSARINVTPVAPDTSQNPSDNSGAFCESNTLILNPSQTATVTTLNGTSVYDSTRLALHSDNSRILLAFDLSALPVFYGAELHYSNVGANSNGSMRIFLASHNEWPVTASDEDPHAVTSMATAQAGWEAGGRYASTLDTSLLPMALTTLILDLESGSDILALSGLGTSDLSPQLVISGDNAFCDNWEANRAEADTDPTTDPTTDPANGTDTAETPKARSGSGNTSVWLLMILMAGFCKRSHQRTSSASVTLRPSAASRAISSAASRSA